MFFLAHLVLPGASRSSWRMSFYLAQHVLRGASRSTPRITFYLAHHVVPGITFDLASRSTCASRCTWRIAFYLAHHVVPGASRSTWHHNLRASNWCRQGHVENTWCRQEHIFRMQTIKRPTFTTVSLYICHTCPVPTDRQPTRQSARSPPVSELQLSIKSTAFAIAFAFVTFGIFLGIRPR